MSAITPAISGVATEVPPTSSAPPGVPLPVLEMSVQPAPSFETQISVAVSRVPSPAKKLTSGIARWVRPLVPVTPELFCHDGDGQPSSTRVRFPYVDPVVSVELQAPKVAEVVFTTQLLEPPE